MKDHSVEVILCVYAFNGLHGSVSLLCVFHVFLNTLNQDFSLLHILVLQCVPVHQVLEFSLVDIKRSSYVILFRGFVQNLNEVHLQQWSFNGTSVLTALCHFY